MSEKHVRYSNPSEEILERANALLSQMTLEEKVGQMNQSVTREGIKDQIRNGEIGSILTTPFVEIINELQEVAVEESRLGIPIIFGFDVIHGCRTIFPIPLAEACTWDPALVEEAERVAAIEAATYGFDWIFAPMVDVSRNPRWGRVAEGSGEDPFLGRAMARARVRGFQTAELPGGKQIVACPKHYAAYGANDTGKDYDTVDISERTLRDIYLPPFKAAFDEGAGSVMTSFNEIDGIPGSAHPLTMKQVLREEWDFDGVVLSDYNSIGELVPHGYAADLEDAALKSVMVGMDMDMEGHAFPEHLADLVRAGVVPEKVVDDAVRRILCLKLQLGLFENPYTDESLREEYIMCDAHREMALKVAHESMVLLENDGILPLDPQGDQNVAVIGPLADDSDAPLGCWAWLGNPENVETVLDGIQAVYEGSGELTYEKACEVAEGFGKGSNLGRVAFDGVKVVPPESWPPERGGDDEEEGPSEQERAQMLLDAVSAAREADVAILVVGESRDMSGEAHSRAYLNLPGRQEHLFQAVAETGTPLIVVVMAGRPLALPHVAQEAAALLWAWHGGLRTGRAVADILYGKVNPSGRLVSSFPRAEGQIPVFYAHKSTGRPALGEGTTQFEDPFRSNYIDESNDPLYPFGYGLSYTAFEYGDLTVETPMIGQDDDLIASVTVTNTGKRTGKEVVQLYVRDLVGSVTRPVKELKGFRKIALEAGESQRVRFVVPVSELGFYGPEMDYIVEPGDFQLWIGPNAAEGLEGSFSVVG